MYTHDLKTWMHLEFLDGRIGIVLRGVSWDEKLVADIVVFPSANTWMEMDEVGNGKYKVVKIIEARPFALSRMFKLVEPTIKNGYSTIYTDHEAIDQRKSARNRIKELEKELNELKVIAGE